MANLIVSRENVRLAFEIRSSPWKLHLFSGIIPNKEVFKYASQAMDPSRTLSHAFTICLTNISEYLGATDATNEQHKFLNATVSVQQPRPNPSKTIVTDVKGSTIIIHFLLYQYGRSGISTCRFHVVYQSRSRRIPLHHQRGYPEHYKDTSGPPCKARKCLLRRITTTHTSQICREVMPDSRIAGRRHVDIHILEQERQKSGKARCGS